MPKKSSKSQREWNGNRRNEDKHYFVHDDRGQRSESSSGAFVGNRPRVSFKNQTHSRGDKRSMARNLEMAVKASFDDDVTMSTNSNNNNNNNVRVGFRGRKVSGHLLRGRNSPVGRGSKLPTTIYRPRSGPLGDVNWYKVVIVFGHKYSKEFIINSLSSIIAPQVFVPIMYKIFGNEAIFYVDDQKIANELLGCDRRITTADGFKIGIRVKPGFPQCDVDNALKEKMKLAMVKRYVAETNALDLSRFHLDPELVGDYFCALFRSTTLMAVLEIIGDALPNLQALNLDNNKLHVIERLNVLSKKLPNLKILYIGDNKIREINQIDVLKDLKLEELKLSGNPVCNKYKTRQEDYVSDVRKRFPKLLRLDGAELPPPILFDVVDDEVKLPPTQRIFVANPRAQEIANQFLQQFFTVMDSDSRQTLLNAYHEQAFFSLTIAQSHTITKFSKYLPDNRNLMRTNDPSRRRKLLKQGRLPIVTYISTFPKTQHYLDSFTMDIGFVTDAMMLITVTGCFKELDTKEQPIRFFHRTFLIVPEGSGYCIKNEQLHLAHPTNEQEKNILNPPAPAPIVQSPPGPSAATSTVTGEPSDEIKQQMTVTLSAQTNMNLDWSLKCLKEVQWNFDMALAAFHEFFKRGQIPPEAFKK